MQKAKEAVSNFISRDGKHTTAVDEHVRPAVTEEHIQPQKHENVTTAVDREVHQHHHHTSVQPLKAKEVLPEQHHHNIAGVEHKTFHHGNDKDVQTHLDRDAAKYKDSTVTHDTRHTTSTAPVVEGQHTHHHVHEHIQPVVQKEVVQPHVVHTTIPVHETHHAEAVHHGTSVLPTKTLDEFRGSGGVLEGRGVNKLNEYEGCPPTYNKDLQQEQLEGDKHMHLHSNHVHNSNSTHGDGSRTGATGTRSGVSGLDNSTTTGHHSTTTGHHSNNRDGSDLDGRDGRDGRDVRDTTDTTGQTTKKASLADRLNPFKDADGDGKKGLMD